MNKLLIAGGVLLAIVIYAVSGYNGLQGADEQVKAGWSEVLNQYQRRADLVPNLVNTVKGAAAHEQDTLLAVTNARARATGINVTPELINDPQAFNKFVAAQGELSSALSRLLVVAERYPDLKANTSFRDLQAQLEGTENRITVARNRYIQTVQAYNIKVRSFPANMIASFSGLTVRPNFAVTDEKAVSTPPTVDFGAGNKAGAAK